MRFRPDSTTIISGTEPGGEVSSATTSSFLRIDCRLPNTAFFPRLSVLGHGWSEYRWKFLRVRYRTIQGSNTAGRVVLAAGYDIDADVLPPTSVDALTEFAPMCENVVWRDLKLTIPCGSNEFQENWYPVGTLTGSDVRIPVYVWFASDRVGSAFVIGHIYIDYVIELKRSIDPNANP
jgi:mRNA-degrading endonuclease HigB of HigAB toxin-antitoxin module